MKKYIAYVFLFIFSLQVLPIKEIGKILYKGLITEERSEADACEDDMPVPKLKKESDPFHSDIDLLAIKEYTTAQIRVAIHNTDNMPDWHVPDILTPPPNCFHI